MFLQTYRTCTRHLFINSLCFNVSQNLEVFFCIFKSQLVFSELMHLICSFMIVISTAALTGATAAVLLPVMALYGVISMSVLRWVYGTQCCLLHYG